MNNKNDIKKSNIPSQIKNYKIEKELYSISNSYICLGINLNLNEKVLLKIYDKEIIHHNYEEISLINTEIYIMRLINHKNCIKLYEIIESPSFIFLICEYCSGVKLSELINRKKKLTEDESLNIYKQIISILIYFQEMKIIHLNLNPENILIDINNNIKLCDFKYCSFYKTKEKIKCEQFGDNNYMCPELWTDKTCYPELADIWSSGVLFYFLLVGQLPFKGINNYDLQKKIMGGEFSLPLNISKNMQEFFKNIFEPKIEMRYDLEKMMNSALFKEKKITKNHLPKGFNIFTTKYPIDERALEIYKSNFDSNIENLKQKLSKNIFDSHTSLYKQIISCFIRKKISSEIDLNSKKYISYITSEQNLFDENTRNNNIKENFEKFEEIKNKFPEEKIKIIKKQNNLLNKLKTLMDKKNIPKDLPIKTGNENKEKKEKIKSSKKVIIKENDNKNKNDKNDKNNKINSNNKNIKNAKRGTLYSITFKAKLRKSKLFDNKLNLTLNDDNKKRKSCLITSNLKYHSNALDNNSLKDLNKLKSGNNKSKKYISSNKDVIKESKEEEKRHSSESSNISSRNSSESKTTSKIKENNKKESSKNITSETTSRNNKNIKVNSVPSKNEKINKEKRNSKVQKIPQINKEDFFSQLKGVKLKKYTPNTTTNQNEIKNKPKEENKNQSSIEHNNKVSNKDEKQKIEENSDKNLTNFNSQPKNDKKRKSVYDLSLDISETKLIKEIENLSQKKEKPKITKEQIKKYSRQRKSLNYTELFLFKTKGILINFDDILKERSKDDAHQYKVRTYNNLDNIIEEDIKELAIPKINKLDTNIINSKKELEDTNVQKEKEEIIINNNDERERKTTGESDKKKKEEINMNDKEEKRKIVKDEETIRNEEEEIRKKEDAIRKKEEEIKQKEEEIIQKEEEIIKKEKEEENKIKEERTKIKEEELRLKQEEEKIRKELEEEERQRKIKEAEEEKKRIEEEELKRKHLEEMEKRRKEEEEEEKRKKEEERIRKEKEKERLRLEEEEKIRKWKEEKKKQKEEEEKIQKEKEEKEKKEEEEKTKKKKKKKKKKRKQEQEENKKRLEEYEKKQKEDEDKKLLRESIKKQKEEEIRKKRDSQLQIMRESIVKKNQKEESESVVDSKKNIFDSFNNFFFSDKEIKKEKKVKKESIFIKNKEKSENESQEKLKLFYHYQQNSDKDNQKLNNRSCETLKNNKNNTKIIYQPIQNNYNVYILNKRASEENLNQNGNSQKSYKKLKIKTEKKGKRKIFSNNIHSIKLKNLDIKSPSEEKELMTEIIDTNDIKSNNAFKKINMGKIFKKIKIYRAISSINKKTQEQNTSPILTTSDNNFSPSSKQSIKLDKKEKYNSIKKNNEKNNNNINNNSVTSNSSLYLKNKKKEYNNTYQAKSKYSKKIELYNNVPAYDIYNSNKSPKAIIRIKKNSQKQKKQKCINENELHIYRGNIDYNNVSLKNVQETIDRLINKYQKEGYDCIKKEKSKFNFVKGNNKYLIEIMRLGNGLLYCNITES